MMPKQIVNFLLMIFLSRVAGEAYISVMPRNVSALAGTSVSFPCHVIGDQERAQTLHFSKVELTEPSVLALDSRLVNASKYGVTGHYDYTVYNLSPEDEGFYQCVLFPQEFQAYLSVSVPPEVVTLTWPSNRTWVQRDVPLNLTCVSRRSKPPANFRWYKGYNDITLAAHTLVMSQDSEGYGDSVSTLELKLGDEDEAAPFTCIVDLPGAEKVTESTVWVAFSYSPVYLGPGPGMLWILLFNFFMT